MNFNEFEKEILLYFRKILGEEYTITINEVRKNNNIVLNGLLMKKEGQNVTPNIYLNHYYEQYIEGAQMEQIEREIWNTYMEALESFEVKNFNFEMELEQQKDKIVYRLINYKENEEKLKQLPHIRFLDLAITFYCYVDFQYQTLSMVPISHELAKKWEIGVKELLAYAHCNTPRIFPVMWSSLEDVVRSMMSEEQFRETMREHDDDVSMFVVTNEAAINGATVILYEEAFNEIAETLGGRVFILPSSIHEVVLLPYDEKIETEYLALLVKEVNLTQVPWEDVLSNHIYYYDSKTKSFEIV